MIEGKDWRLVDNIAVYVINSNVGEDKVYLASLEKKTYENAVLKEIGNEPYNKLLLDEASFRLKLGKNFSISISSPLLPGGESKFYKVMNSYCGKNYNFISEIISQVENKKGDFGDTEFETIFSDQQIGKVFFVTREMDFYNQAFQEMRRRINCQICKKTKKWIPGHRYDSEIKTYYYLGSFVSRKAPIGEYLNDFNTVPVHLVIEEIKDTDKKISDVLGWATFGDKANSITPLYLTSFPSMVDCGKFLDNDVKDIQNYWPKMIDNTISQAKPNEFGYTSYEDIFRNLFNIFSIQNKDNLVYNIPDDSKEKLEKIVENVLISDILLWWDISMDKSDSNISSSNDIDKNQLNLVTLFFRCLKDENLKKNLYYPELFKNMGIRSLEDIARSALINYNPSNLVFGDSMESYVKNGSIYFATHDQNMISKESIQRVNSTNYALNVVTVEELFVLTPNLCSLLKEISKEAIDNCGIGVEKFYQTNIGNRKNPKIYNTVVINIKDIVNYYGGYSNVPEDIVREIKESKFWKFTLNIDKGAEIK